MFRRHKKIVCYVASRTLRQLFKEDGLRGQVSREIISLRKIATFTLLIYQMTDKARPQYIYRFEFLQVPHEVISEEIWVRGATQSQHFKLRMLHAFQYLRQLPIKFVISVTNSVGGPWNAT